MKTDPAHPSTGLKESDLKLHTVVGIMYSLVAAGAFGIETMVSSSGPGLTIVMLLVLPFVWAAPQAFAAAELGSAIPEAGGFYKWIQRGLGEFWSFQAGWTRTFSCYIDNAIYVVLAASYLGALIPMTNGQAYIVKAAIIIIFTYINLRGIKDVGNISALFSLIVVAAFAFVAIIGFANWSQNPFLPFTPPGETMLASIGYGLAIGMWMYSGYTAMSTLSGEIKDKSLIPKGLLIILPLSALSYVLPTMGGLAALGQWDLWSAEGGISYGTVAALAGDYFLPIFVIVAILANLSIYNSYIISISRCFFAMAEDKLAPKSLVKLSKKNRVPYVGVIGLAVFNLILCAFDFKYLVTVDVMLILVDYVLVWFSGIALRIKEPDMPRPFRIPVGTFGFIMVVMPGILIAVVALFLNGTDYFLGGLLGFLTAPIMYYIWKRMYGGLAVTDPINHPLNPKTKLAVGDLHRISFVLFLLGVLGLFAGFFFMQWYEGAWAADYYAETYGAANAFDILIMSIRILAIAFVSIGAIIKLIAHKVDPLKEKSSAIL